MKRDLAWPSLSLTPAQRARAARDAIRAIGVEGMWRGATLYGPVHFEVSAAGGRLLLNELWVSPSARGTGKGTEVLQLICGWADWHWVPVRTRVEPFGPGRRAPRKKLTEWYAAHGFEPSGRGEWLVRRAQPWTFGKEER